MHWKTWTKIIHPGISSEVVTRRHCKRKSAWPVSQSQLRQETGRVRREKNCITALCSRNDYENENLPDNAWSNLCERASVCARLAVEHVCMCVRFWDSDRMTYHSEISNRSEHHDPCCCDPLRQMGPTLTSGYQSRKQTCAALWTANPCEGHCGKTIPLRCVLRLKPARPQRRAPARRRRTPSCPARSAPGPRGPPDPTTT